MCPLLTDQTQGNRCRAESNSQAQGKSKVLVRKKIKIHHPLPRSSPNTEHLTWSLTTDVQSLPPLFLRCLTFAKPGFSDHYPSSQGYQGNWIVLAYMLCDIYYLYVHACISTHLHMYVCIYICVYHTYTHTHIFRLLL